VAPGARGAGSWGATPADARALLVGAFSLALLVGRATRRLRSRPALLACAALLALAAAPRHFLDAAAPWAASPALRAVEGARPAAAPPPGPANASHLRVLFAAQDAAPLRRHAILLTGAIRDLTAAFPTLLHMLRATPGGFDVYAVLSPTRGGWTNADRDEAEDEAALAWLRALPAAQPRVALQLLAYDTTPTLGPLSAELRALFPGFHTYDFRQMVTPGVTCCWS
jgi:hypothetical protein